MPVALTVKEALCPPLTLKLAGFVRMFGAICGSQPENHVGMLVAASKRESLFVTPIV